MKRTVSSAASTSLLSLLRAPTNDVYLIGTAHVSAASERAVRSVIQAVRPGVVMVELCDDRARAMRQNARGPSLMDALGHALPFLSGHPDLKPYALSLKRGGSNLSPLLARIRISIPDYFHRTRGGGRFGAAGLLDWWCDRSA